jgi:hypothetical protein
MGLLRRFYKKLPYMRELNDIRDLLQTLVARSLDEYAAHALPERSQRGDPRRLAGFERQVFSQNGEDGILAEIFRRIGVASGRFVEIGAGNGLENNSAYLLLQGWSGLWIDAHPKMTTTARKQYGAALEEKRLQLAERFIDAANVGPIFAEFGVADDFELLSLDIDRNTYYVWEALAACRPKVVAVEYNAQIPPSVEWKVEYDPQKCWNGTSYFGASLKAYERLGDRLGYKLVGCDLTGVNAFFVRSDLVNEQFCGPFTAENHYEPPRYWLVRRDGHPRCFDDRTRAA